VEGDGAEFHRQAGALVGKHSESRKVIGVDSSFLLDSICMDSVPVRADEFIRGN
jgi:hypothetical protein